VLKKEDRGFEDENRERAKRNTGAAEAKFLLRVSDDLDKRARKAAKREGISLTEWYRRAAEAALG
jgi:predicted HicB family RNase H-like nuclease